MRLISAINKISVVALLAATTLAGCGGGNNTVVDVTPKVTIDWPALTRGIQGPTYAGSADISLLPQGAATATEWNALRPAGDAAQSITYPAPSTVPAGPALLTVKFRSGALGPVAATASVNVSLSGTGVILKSDGSNLGTVTYGTTITSLNLAVESMAVGDTKDLLLAGQTPDGSVALISNLANYEITAGGEHATIADAKITGVSEGTVTVKVTYEGISATKDITISPAIANPSRYVFDALHTAYDTAHGKVWGAFRFPSAKGNCIVDIDPLTGTEGTPIPIDFGANRIGVSADGTRALLFTGDGKLAVVDLVNRSVLGTTNLPGDFFYAPLDIVFNPTNNDQVAIVTRDSGSNPLYGGPYVLDHGTLLTGTKQSRYLLTVDWISNNEIALFGNTSTVGVGSKYTIASDVTINGMVGLAEKIAGPVMNLGGSKVLTGDGKIFSTTDFSLVTTLTTPGETYVTGTVDVTNNIAWFVTADPVLVYKKVRGYNLTTGASVGSITIPYDGSFKSIQRVGATGLSVITSTAVITIPHAPGL